jgi:hypothetical protein
VVCACLYSDFCRESKGLLSAIATRTVTMTTSTPTLPASGERVAHYHICSESPEKAQGLAMRLVPCRNRIAV